MKFVIVLIAVVVLIWLVFGGRSRASHGARKADPPTARGRSEGMVACAHCGMHLPESEALRLGSHAYCSAEHRDAGPRVAK